MAQVGKDVEIRKASWEGQVPIVFQLNADEVTSLSAPDPYYISFQPLPLSSSFVFLSFSFMCSFLNAMGSTAWHHEEAT